MRPGLTRCDEKPKRRNPTCLCAKLPNPQSRRIAATQGRTSRHRNDESLALKTTHVTWDRSTVAPTEFRSQSSLKPCHDPHTRL
ncbi:hypothetical protein GCM10027186_18180 [Micromonospora schwarzwaldensis]